MNTKQPLVYEIENLEDARDFLLSCDTPVVLANTPGTTKYYGMLVIDYMFKKLTEEFSEKIVKIIVNVEDNHPALFTAIKLNYKDIIYTGNSAEAIKIYELQRHRNSNC
ncbi:hypothetical protein [Rickettsia endosymbiont of Halotydeus destructor]|uniref:hypothetical protein n=1 Tax=Rickettsia endosymbiont of Halotydeus destructor TaxID=2996754 RepID=UPI003BB118BB